MGNLKRMGAALLSLALISSLNLNALAAVEDTGYADVDAGSWYAQAVEYVRDNGLMSGTSDAQFPPAGTMTRVMLAQTLYRRRAAPPSRAATPSPTPRRTPGTPTPSCGPPGRGSSAATEAGSSVPTTR